MTSEFAFAFVPARGGSTGVKGKNIRLLHGRPLILHTVDFALESDWFNQVVVSTDNFEIASIATEGKLRRSEFDNLEDDSIIDVSRRLLFHKRKPEDAQTLSPIRDVLFDLANTSRIKDEFDLLMMLQPTSPFRRHGEIESIKEIVKRHHEFTSLVSVTPVGGFHPDRMYRLNEGTLTAYIDQANKDNKPRQLLEELYIKDGSYYLLTSKSLQKRELLGDNVLAFVRSGLCTINIDEEKDFKIAELINFPYEDGE